MREASRAAEQSTTGLLELYNKELVDNFTDGDDSNDLQGVLDWQVNTGGLVFDDLATMAYYQPAVC